MTVSSYVPSVMHKRVRTPGRLPVRQSVVRRAILWSAVLLLTACGASSPAAGGGRPTGDTATTAAVSSVTAGSQQTLAGTTSVAAAPGDPVAAGNTLFHTVGCSGCHGDQGQGNIGPKIAGTGLTVDAVLQQVRQPRGQMPPFTTAQISDDQVRQVYAYLESLAPPTPTPAPTATAVPTVAGQPTPTPVPKPVDVDSIAKAVDALKVASDYAHDGSKTVSDVKGYTGQASTALKAAQDATRTGLIAGGGSVELRADLTKMSTLLAKVAPEVQAAGAATSLQDAEPHTHAMVLASRLDLLPLAMELIRVNGEVGSVTGVVKDTSGKPVADAFITIEGGGIHTGLLTDASGAFKASGIAAFPSVEVKAYKANYLYVESHANVSKGGTTNVDITIPPENNPAASPKVSANEVTATASGAETMLYIADMATQKDNRIAEDQVWALSPQLGVAYVLRATNGSNYAADAITPTLKSGTYTWYFFATTHDCDMSNVLQQTLTVQ